MEEIADFELLEWIKNLDPANLGIDPDFANEVNSFLYEGFNAAYIVRHLDKKAGDAGLLGVAKIKDIASMVAIALIRGNLREDTMKKTSDAGLLRIETLVSRYGISMKKDAKGKIVFKKDTVTFVRVMQCFPVYAGTFLAENWVSPPQLRVTKWKVDKLPAAMQCSAFSSMMAGINSVGSDDVYRTLRLAGIAWSVCYNHTINVKSKGRDDLKRVPKFFDMGQNYSLAEADVLNNALVDFGIINKDGGLHPNVQITAMEFNVDKDFDEVVDFDNVGSDPKLAVYSAKIAELHSILQAQEFMVGYIPPVIPPEGEGEEEEGDEHA